MRRSGLVSRWYSGDDIVIPFDCDRPFADSKIVELQESAKAQGLTFTYAVGEWEVGKVWVEEVVKELSDRSQTANRNGAASAKSGEVNPVHQLSLKLILSGCLIAVFGCGDDDSVSGGREDTPFGNLSEVEVYRLQLNPVIDAVNEVQTQVQAEAVGSGNVATAENLNSVYTQVRPRLLEALVELDRIVPPSRLVPLHDDVRLLMVLRIDAQALVIEAFADGDGETLYARAETKLEEANALVVDLNARLCVVDNAINPSITCDAETQVIR